MQIDFGVSVADSREMTYLMLATSICVLFSIDSSKEYRVESIPLIKLLNVGN